MPNDHKTLQDLAALPLEVMVTTACVNAHGGLSAVGSVNDKIAGITAYAAHKPVLSVLVSTEQSDIRAEHVGNEQTPVLGGHTLADLLGHALNGSSRAFGTALPWPDLLHSGAYLSLHPREDAARRIGAQIKRHGLVRGSYSTVTADPTFGKTAFAATWVRGELQNILRPDGWVFARRGPDPDTSHPLRVLLGLERSARQALGLRLNPFTRPGGLAFSGLEDLRFQQHFRQFLNDCSRAAKDRCRPVVLLMDGVDEVWGVAGSHPASHLPVCLPREMPPGVHMVMLSRPGVHLHWKNGRCEHFFALDLSSDANAPADAKNYLDSLIEGWQKCRPDVAPPSHALQVALLRNSQNNLHYLREVVGTPPEPGSPQCELRSAAPGWLRWSAKPQELPSGVAELFARTLVRLVWSSSDATQRRCRMLYLAAAALLQRPLTELDLRKLLAVPVPASSDMVFELSLHRAEFDLSATALQYAAEAVRDCWERPDSERSTLQWTHLLMRDCALALWVLLKDQDFRADMPYTEDFGSGGDLLKLMRLIADTATQGGLDHHPHLKPVHHVLWLGCSPWLVPERKAESSAVECYSLEWGAWHAARGGVSQARRHACDLLADSQHLQRALAVGQPESLDLSWQELELSEPRLQVIARTLRPLLPRIKQGRLQVAQALPNTLGRWEEAGNWRERWSRGAVRGAWRSLQLGTVEPGVTVVDGLVATDQCITAGSADTARWWVMARGKRKELETGDECRIFGLDEDPTRPTLKRVPGLDGVNAELWAACESPPKQRHAGSAPAAGVWIARTQGLDCYVAMIEPTGTATWLHVLALPEDATSTPNALAVVPWLQDASAGVCVAVGTSTGTLHLAWVMAGSSGIASSHTAELPLPPGEPGAYINALAGAPAPDGGVWVVSGTACRPNQGNGLGRSVHVYRLQAPSAAPCTHPKPQPVTHTWHEGWVKAVATLPTKDGGLWLASGGDDGQVFLVKLGPGGNGLPATPPKKFTSHRRWVTALALAPESDGGGWLASGGNDCVAQAWAFHPDGTPKRQLLQVEHGNWIESVAWLPDAAGLRLATSGTDGLVRIADTVGGDSSLKAGAVAAFDRHGGRVTSISLLASNNPTGMWVASGAEDHQVHLTRVRREPSAGGGLSGSPMIVRHDERVNATAMCAAKAAGGADGGVWLASGGDDKIVHVVRVDADGVAARPNETGQEILKTDRFVTSLALHSGSGDGAWLATGLDSGQVKVYRLACPTPGAWSRWLAGWLGSLPKSWKGVGSTVDVSLVADIPEATNAKPNKKRATALAILPPSAYQHATWVASVSSAGVLSVLQLSATGGLNVRATISLPRFGKENERMIALALLPAPHTAPSRMLQEVWVVGRSDSHRVWVMRCTTDEKGEWSAQEIQPETDRSGPIGLKDAPVLVIHHVDVDGTTTVQHWAIDLDAELRVLWAAQSVVIGAPSEGATVFTDQLAYWQQPARNHKPAALPLIAGALGSRVLVGWVKD